MVKVIEEKEYPNGFEIEYNVSKEIISRYSEKQVAYVRRALSAVSECSSKTKKIDIYDVYYFNAPKNGISPDEFVDLYDSLEYIDKYESGNI